MRLIVRVMCAGTLLLTGCASIGPPAVVRDRFDYVTAISDSWKRQTLLNLVKVRYSDAPVLMDVTSVISAYTLGSDVRIGRQDAPSGHGDTFTNLSAGAHYADTPTITYQPLSGDKFARSMMAPIPVTGILALIQAGYPADVVLRLCVNSVNGLDNDWGGVAPREGSVEFRELISELRQVQDDGGTGFRTRTAKDKQTVTMFFRPAVGAAAPRSQRIRELLGLDPRAREFSVIYGSFPEPDGDIAILSRSILQVMMDLASHIDVPATDVADRRVSQRTRTAEQDRMFPSLIKVHTGLAPPDDPQTVAVRYRNAWFWIDDRDEPSKRMLTFLMLMFSLTESAPTQATPMVTIPAR